VHEVSLMQGALEIALEEAARRGATRVHRITLRVGELSGAVPEALAFAFDVVSRDTPADGARLVIEPVPAACLCTACGEEFRPEPGIFVCPRCGRPSTDVQAGNELELAQLEVS
jgi:hydrogenase nickel incorporation protein HypA/HybF